MVEAVKAHALETQVGGHNGIMASEDSSLVMKPALPLEIAFYQMLNADSAFAPLRPFVPCFFGTLRLEGQLINPDGDMDSENMRVIILENLEHPFLRPNILDIKLGTVLYDEVDASPEKKERLIEAARKTTSLETGVRLTGFQVHDNITNEPVLTPKSYGKSIDKSQLPEGIARFFPVGSKEEGKPSLGLPVSLLLPILHGIKRDIKDIRDAIASLEMRMVGGSLLIVYEAEWSRAEEGLKRLEDDVEDELEDENDGSDEEEEKTELSYLVKVIDFAHTRWTPGRGPDEGVLKGIDTVLGLIDGRIREVSSTVET